MLPTWQSFLESFGLRLAIYFLVGGTVTALAAYFASHGRGILSAFVTTLPLLTIFSFLIISAEGGSQTVQEYARGLLLFTPPWVCYVVVVMLGTERMGLVRSLVLGVAIFILLSLLLQKAIPGPKL
jgi:uncharacterized membrane protein (GlpM family)